SDRPPAASSSSSLVCNNPAVSSAPSFRQFGSNHTRRSSPASGLCKPGTTEFGGRIRPGLLEAKLSSPKLGHPTASRPTGERSDPGAGYAIGCSADNQPL